MAEPDDTYICISDRMPQAIHKFPPCKMHRDDILENSYDG